MNINTRIIIADIIIHIVIYFIVSIPIFVIWMINPDTNVEIVKDWKYYINAACGLIIGFGYGYGGIKTFYNPIHNFVSKKIFKL